MTSSSPSPVAATSILDTLRLKPTRIKFFCDMVHSHVELPLICYKIINTRQFQRLRNLKQLGLCYYVYPTACHNRFEHCIGTSYLAGTYCKILQTNQPELNIDNQDLLCVYIAGLLHDLGHGPFSHTWEQFISTYDKNYSHEEMSIKMMDYLLESNDLWTLCKYQAGLTERDLVFIKEIILGHPISGDEFQGRPPNKHFLYQIVSNDITKIDVDKFDYILRDCTQLNVKTGFDFQRIFNNSRVFFVRPGLKGAAVEVAESAQDSTVTIIAYRKKISSTLQELFLGRFSLHQKAYQHKVVRIVEMMVVDGLKAAEPYFRVPSSTDPAKVLKLSTAHQDVSAFIKITDSVLEQIIEWGNGGASARKIFNDIINRKLYKCIGYLSDQINEDLLDDLKACEPALLLCYTSINYGRGDENPLNSALFYVKARPGRLFKHKFSGPNLESKCFFLLRPTYAYEEGETTSTISEEDEQKRMQLMEEKVELILQKHEVELELE
ncbi:deoxynucleoside triphosphate triphosphohydrolase SAMHD1 isoform X2 [Folsomia candida]|uniref:deoxynucleoside triphosphate triphosphohydrolase SAMHD1 isoform X2 n=1 Tax=Folsomia candida TaxID=158441 RepID=UPI00160502D1|nr:deoxynucleoside triphosphate triphosphohydrolase SAMHD1 isoform X2 [Folsomia candida]